MPVCVIDSANHNFFVTWASQGNQGLQRGNLFPRVVQEAVCSDRKQVYKLHQCCFSLLGRNECQSYRVTDLTLALSKSDHLTPQGVGRRAKPWAGACSKCSKAAHSQLTVRFLHTFQSVTDFVRVKLKFLTKQNLQDGMAWM